MRQLRLNNIQTFISNIALLILCLIGKSVFSQSPLVDPHWDLYRDWNFKTMSWTTLNQQWITNPCTKALDHKNGDVEPQSYQGNNVTINGNGLKLTVKQEQLTDKVVCVDPNFKVLSDGGYNLRTTYYTSGYVETKDSLKYGFIEARIKMPFGFNFFPAFWTFKMSGAAQNGAEIDIFEMVPAFDYANNNYDFPNSNIVAKTNCHLFYGDSADPYDPPRNEDIILSSSCTNYHKYGVEWSPSKIIWYFDDQIVRVLVNPGVHDFNKTIVNLALNPWENVSTILTTFPSSMEVDYVRWYKLNNIDCNNVINNCAFWFGGYQPTVKKSISISGGCSNTQPVNTNLILRATDFIQFNGEFTVPYGASLYADVNPCY